VPADTSLIGTANIAGATSARVPILPRNALGREIKNSDQLRIVSTALHRWPCIHHATRRINQPVPAQQSRSL